MRRPIALLLTLAATPAVALTPAQQQAVNLAWDNARAEQGVLLTCAALTPDLEKGIRKDWEAMRQNALATMAAADWPADDLTRITAETAPDALRLPDTTPFGEVIQWCLLFPEWPTVAETGGATRLDEDVAAILKAAP